MTVVALQGAGVRTTTSGKPTSRGRGAGVTAGGSSGADGSAMDAAGTAAYTLRST